MRVYQVYKIIDKITAEQFRDMERDRRVVIRKTIDGHVVSMEHSFRNKFRETFGLMNHQLGNVRQDELQLLLDESFGVPCHVTLH